MSVVVSHLAKAFGPEEAPAVADISFHAPAGAITALIGPSGAGKSTALRLIAGLEQPDAGTIHIAGADVTRMRAQDRGIGLVFQSYALFENMSVRDNIAFGLDVKQSPFAWLKHQARKNHRARTQERVDKLLRLIRLESLADRRPAQLSGGQRQRVAFARALAIEPKVLLLDEPFGALDARVRADLREWLLELHEQTKLTTLLVTHDQDEALEVSEHVVILLDGKVAQAGAPQDVYDRPATPATASFLGARPLRAHVENGHAHVGALARALPEGAAHVHDGHLLDAFVRPQDVRLTRAPSEEANGAPLAQVERVRVVGARVKVSLALKATGERVNVDVSREELDALGLSVGDLVLLDVKTARVFLGDFAI